MSYRDHGYDATKDAKHLLVHYLRLLAKASGQRWDEDNDAEVEMIVEAIIRAAMYRALAVLEERREGRA